MALECPSCDGSFRVPIPRVEPGTTIGNFRIDSKLGTGGMGDVFLATQISMSRHVALKVLPQSMTRQQHVVDRFLHEVRMSARLEHSHVVTAFEAGEDNGHYFLAMSYVDGKDLGSLLREAGAIPEQKALRYVGQVADALSYAWDNFKLLHRDIKPSNIMVDHTDNAKLMDMGISKCIEDHDASLTVSGMVIGTPYYMSPEQARSGKDLDSRSDMYALGATLYHLVVGVAPYLGDSTVSVLSKHAFEPFPSPRERNPAVSLGCVHLLHSMMAKAPEQRYQTWRALIEDIERVRKGMPPKQARPKEAVPVPAATVAAPAPVDHEANTVEVAVPDVIGAPGVSSKTDAKLPPVVNSTKMLRTFVRMRRIKLIAASVAGLLLLLLLLLVLIMSKRKPEQMTGSGGNVAGYISADDQLRRFFANAIDDLLADRKEQLRTRMLNVMGKPEFKQYAVELGEFAALLRNLRRADRFVQDSFRQDIGKRVHISFESGDEMLLIQRVVLDRIVAVHRKRYSGGRLESREFTVKDIAVSERLKRLEAYSHQPAVALAMGLAYLKQDDFAKARDSFLKLPKALRGTFMHKVNKLQQAK